MAGKPTTPPSVIRRIRTLRKDGKSMKAIAAQVGVGTKTVRKAIDPAFAERERLRHAARAAAQYAARKDNPDYIAYQAERSDTDARRKQVRLKMAALRAARKDQASLT